LIVILGFFIAIPGEHAAKQPYSCSTKKSQMSQPSPFGLGTQAVAKEHGLPLQKNRQPWIYFVISGR
jgi:hypothetical protein